MIPQNKEKIKSKNEKKEKTSQAAKWQLHKADACRMAGKMAGAGFAKRAERMLMCGNDLVFERCPDCGYIALKRAYLCRDRLCPLCAWRLSIKRYAAMQKILSAAIERYPDDTYALITLTCQNTASDNLKKYLSEMQEAWRYVISQRWVRTRLRGWARSIEVTFNRNTGELHPHYHVLVQAPMLKIAEGFIDEWLVQCSQHGIRATKAAQNIQKIKYDDEAGDSLAGAVCEVYKYMIKTSDALEMPIGKLKDLANGISGKRLISMGGCLKTISKDLQLEELDEPDNKDEDTKLCLKCGSRMIDELALRWACAGGRYIASSSDIQSAIDAAAEGRLKVD